MVTDEEVLRFFQNELPISGLLPTKENRVKMDEALQEYAEEEDLFPAINKYAQVFNIDLSVMNIENYYPWKTAWFFRRGFTQKPLEQISKPLTVRMFAEPAKAGRWLYD